MEVFWTGLNMKSFFGICVISALAAVGTTQPTHNSQNHDGLTHNWPHHDVGQTQYHKRPEHHMSQPESPMNQPQHHIMSQPEPHIRQPHHYISQPQHDYDSWSTVQAQAQAHSQATWQSPEQPSYQPGEISSEPHHINQPHHIIHSQPQPIDPQFELHPYLYQHPHYPPTGSHHTQDSGPHYPTQGWNTQNPADYQHQLPEAPAPVHHINANKEDYPNQSSAVASAVATSFSNSVPVSNHEPAHSGQYKMISIKKPDDGADFHMPVADHETRHPVVIHASKDEGLSDIVQAILAKYRNSPIGIKPKADNNAPSKDHKTESHDPVHKPHKYKMYKVPTIPVVTQQNAKVKKHKHKHSHKKVLKPLLDPELLAKEFNLLSKELWVPSPDKTHEKDIPCDDNPIVPNNRTNSDKNEPKDKAKVKPDHKKHSHKSADTSPDKNDSGSTTPTSYIEPYDKKDVDEDTNSDLASLGTEPCDGDNPPETEDKRKKHEPKPNINEKKIINSKPNDDFKEEDFVQKHEVKTELTKKVEIEKEQKLEVSETKTFEGKPNQKKIQNPFETTESCDEDNAPEEENEKKKHVLKPKTDDKQKSDPVQNKPNNNATTEPCKSCDAENTLKEEHEKKKHAPKPKTDGKQNNDSNKNILKNKLTKHHQHKHVQLHTPKNIVPDNDKTKTIQPSLNVKLSDQKDTDRDSDCDLADSGKTMEPHYTVNGPDKEDKTKKHQPKPKPYDTKNTTSKPVDNEGNIHAITDHIVVQKKDTNKEEIKEVETKKEKTVHQSEKTKQQPDTIDVKQKSLEQVYNAPVSDESDSTEDSIYQGPYDKIPDSENKDKKERSTPYLKKDDDKPQPVNTNKENKDTITDHIAVEKKDVKKEQIIKVKTNKEKTVHQTEKFKPIPETTYRKQKPVEQDYNAPVSDGCDSTEGSIYQGPYDKIPDSEYKDKKEQSTPHLKKNHDKPQPVNTNKGNKDTIIDHIVVQKKDVKKEQIIKVKTNKEKTVHQTEKFKPIPETTYRKQMPVEQDYNAPVSDGCDSTEGSIYQGPYDEIPDSEYKYKKDQSIPHTKKDENKPEPINTNKENKDTIIDHIVVQKKDVKKEELKKIEINKEETVQQSEKTKPQSETIDEKQKPVERDNNAPVSDECDSTEGSVYQEPYDKIPDSEYKYKKDQSIPHIKKDENKPEPVNTNKENKDTIIDHIVVQKKDVKKEELKKIEINKEETVQQSEKTKPQSETIDEKQKPVERDNNAPVSDECDSTEGSVYQEPYDKIPDSEYKYKKDQSIPHIKKDENKPEPVNTNKEIKDTIIDHIVVQKKDVKKEELKKIEINKEETVQQSEKTKPQSEIIDEKQKPVERDNNAPVSDECDSTEGSVYQEPYDKIPHSEYKDKKEQSIPHIKKDDNKPEPVNTNKENKDTKTDHIVVQKKDVKKEEIKKIEIIKEETKQQSEKSKPKLETNDSKQKPVERDFNAPVSDEYDSTEGSVYQGPYDKISAPEHAKEKKPLPNKKDDYKPVGPDTDKGNKDNISIAKKEVKKVEKTKELTRKIYQTMKYEPKLHKYEDILKPEKQGKTSSDIEDCDSTESSKLQKPLGKNSAPEHKREYKEPLLKANQNNKASKVLTKEKKMYDEKEKTVTIETKTKNSAKNVVSSKAVDKSKPAETSNENSDIDNCDSVDSETDPKLEKIKPNVEKPDPKKKKAKGDKKKKVLIARNKADGKATDEDTSELTSGEVAKILKKTETDQPLSTVGFLISLFSHALQGSDSVKQMFEDPKVKKFVKNIIPMFHEKPN